MIGSHWISLGVCLTVWFRPLHLADSAADGEQMIHPSDLRDATWSSWTLPAGFATAATWKGLAPGCGVDVCSAHADVERELIVSAETEGRMRLFRYPASHGDARPRVYRAHASRIASVRFSVDGAHVFSLGGADGSLLQWRVVRGTRPLLAPAAGPAPVLLRAAEDDEPSRAEDSQRRA